MKTACVLNLYVISVRFSTEQRLYSWFYDLDSQCVWIEILQVGIYMKLWKKKVKREHIFCENKLSESWVDKNCSKKYERVSADRVFNSFLSHISINIYKRNIVKTIMLLTF